MLAAGLSFGINKSVFTTCITTALSFSIKRTCTRLEFLKPKSPILGFDTDEMVTPISMSRPKDACGNSTNNFPSVLCNDTKVPLHDSVACSVSARS